MQQHLHSGMDAKVLSSPLNSCTAVSLGHSPQSTGQLGLPTCHITSARPPQCIGQQGLLLLLHDSEQHSHLRFQHSIPVSLQPTVSIDKQPNLVSFPLVNQNSLQGLQQAAARATTNGIVAVTIHKRTCYWQVWTSFCCKYKLDLELTGQAPDFIIPSLQAFAEFV